ncbi:hypothetical protein C8J56DRAFT_1039362 [Mycena floridula]|nr:hypothetical protein C8J56DRAFT_1039362 [Mycena floridula]
MYATSADFQISNQTSSSSGLSHFQPQSLSSREYFSQQQSQSQVPNFSNEALLLQNSTPQMANNFFIQHISHTDLMRSENLVYKAALDEITSLKKRIERLEARNESLQDALMAKPSTIPAPIFPSNSSSLPAPGSCTMPDLDSADFPADDNDLSFPSQTATDTENYIVDSRGNPVPNARHQEINCTACGFWTDMITKYGKIPQNFSTAGLIITADFQYLLESQYEELRFCSNKWKVNRVWSTAYNSWVQGYRKRALSDGNDNADDADSNKENEVVEQAEDDEIPKRKKQKKANEPSKLQLKNPL